MADKTTSRTSRSGAIYVQFHIFRFYSSRGKIRRQLSYSGNVTSNANCRAPEFRVRGKLVFRYKHDLLRPQDARRSPGDNNANSRREHGDYYYYFERRVRKSFSTTPRLKICPRSRTINYAVVRYEFQTRKYPVIRRTFRRPVSGYRICRYCPPSLCRPEFFESLVIGRITNLFELQIVPFFYVKSTVIDVRRNYRTYFDIN